MYRRALDATQRTCCREWWRHAEAISRLEALWRVGAPAARPGHRHLGVVWRPPRPPASRWRRSRTTSQRLARTALTAKTGQSNDHSWPGHLVATADFVKRAGAKRRRWVIDLLDAANRRANPGIDLATVTIHVTTFSHSTAKTDQGNGHNWPGQLVATGHVARGLCPCDLGRSWRVLHDVAWAHLPDRVATGICSALVEKGQRR
jgi:hypothetical protein